MSATITVIGVKHDIIDEMTYSDTINLSAGVITDITTTISSTLEIFNVYLLDVDGNELSPPMITINVSVAAGVYHIYIYSVDLMNNTRLKIIYK